MVFPERHVAALPFPFTSHPWPLANLVLRLAAAAPGVHFSFLNTAKSNNVIFPPHSETDIPPNLRIYNVDAASLANTLQEVELFFKTARSSYEAAIDTAVADIGVQVTCLLTDVVTPSACEIANKLHVKWIAMWVPAPYSLLAHIYTDVYWSKRRTLEERGDNDAINEFEKRIDFIPGLSMMGVADLPDEMLEKEESRSGISCMLAGLKNLLSNNAACVVMNSYEEANPKDMTADLRSKFQSLLHVGCPVMTATRMTRSESDATGCLAWLDEQGHHSVAYISFGTIVMLSPDEISALAEAVEESKTPYLWSLPERHQIHLPAGFVERTGSHGKIVKWAPQGQVLAHPSVGVCLTHGGYNSIFESIAGEVPMICRPFWADNKMNGRMVEDVWQIGVTVEGGTITKKGLAKCLEMVLGGSEEGQRMREKIKALKEVLVEASGPNGSASKDFKTLVDLIST